MDNTHWSIRLQPALGGAWRRIRLLGLAGGILAMPFLLSPMVAAAEEGTVTLDLNYVAIGIGYQEGTAAVTLGGKSATFTVKGAQFLGAGVSNFHAAGTVTGAHSLADIEGDYSVTRGSVTAIVGGATLSMNNSKGVVMKFNEFGSKGVDVSVGPGKLTFTRSN